MVGCAAIQANEDAHGEATALAELLADVAASNAAALQRVNLCSSMQRRMVRSRVAARASQQVSSRLWLWTATCAAET